ncbi:MAG: hypothetical protein VXW91_07010 [Pseudomonadota bacterium]|nr:hypothetical protein [Pseudomonadota bacterium]MEC8664152.1 hypothetical protein [Pseudomonadota bacterium]
MFERLRQAFAIVTNYVSPHEMMMRSLEDVADDDMAQKMPTLLYMALDRIQEHVANEASLKGAFKRASNKAVMVDEERFSREMDMVLKLSRAADFSDTLKEHVKACTFQTAIWVAKNIHRTDELKTRRDLEDFLTEMLSEQAEAFAFEGITFKVPKINFVAKPEKVAGWIYTGKVREDDYLPSEIFINTREIRSGDLSDLLKTVFHEGIHVMFGQIAQQMALKNIAKDSDFYQDGLKLLVKNDLGYTAKTLVASIYFNDPEEALAHSAHATLLELIDTMEALQTQKPPLVLRSPIHLS